MQDESEVGDTEALVLIFPSPPRPVMPASEKVLPRLVKIPKRLLLDVNRSSSKPGLLGAGFCQLAALLSKTRRGTAPRPVLKPLLKAEIPDEPSVCAELQKSGLLRWRRAQPEPRHGRSRPGWRAGRQWPSVLIRPFVLQVTIPVDRTVMPGWLGAERETVRLAALAWLYPNVGSLLAGVQFAHCSFSPAALADSYSTAWHGQPQNSGKDAPREATNPASQRSASAFSSSGVSA